MSTIENARDTILQTAAVRLEPVTLPPTVIVPPGQLGPGALPEVVTGTDGTKVVSANVLRASALYADQIRDSAGNLMFQANGTMSLSRVNGVGALASQNSVNAAAGQVAGLGALAYQAQVFASELGVGTLAAGVLYAGTINADKINGGSFVGKSFTGGEFNGTTFTGVIINTEVLRVNNVKATGYIDAFDLIATGTANVQSLVVGSSIYGPGAGAEVGSLRVNNSATTFNLTSTGHTNLATMSASTITAGGSITSSNDLTGANVYANNSLTIGGSVGGSTGSRIVLANTRRWCRLSIDGVEHTTTIEFGALA